MEPDFQVVVKGLPLDRTERVQAALRGVVLGFEQAGIDLDFRRMHRIIVAADYGAELAELSAATASGNRIKHTNEDYALGIAKVLTLPGDGEPEIVPVFDAQFTVIFAEGGRGEDVDSSDSVRMPLHLLHHEFCHVHDTNKYIDAFADCIFVTSYSGKDVFIRPLAEACWNEYSANLRSSKTAAEEDRVCAARSLEEGVQRTKGLVDEAILAYRHHGDLDVLMDEFGRHGEFLPKSAAYVLGYGDGLGLSLSELSMNADEHVAGSYFESTFKAMHRELRALNELNHERWKSLGVLGLFDGIAAVIEQYYSIMGLDLKTTEDGQAYVDVPLRPETTPDLC